MVIKSDFWSAVFNLVSVTVGAGIFALPYVVGKAGFLTGLALIIGVGVIMAFVSLFLAEVVLRTRGKHQLSGLANAYLGQKGKYAMFFVLFFSIYGALFAYVLGAGEILSSLFLVSAKVASWFFFIILAFLLMFDFDFFTKVESIFTPLKIALAFLISIFILPSIHMQNVTNFSFRSMLAPFGLILFAYLGVSAIPEMALDLKKKVDLKKAIITGIFISGLLYALYAFAFVGAFGANQQEVSVLSLGRLSNNLFVFGCVFGVLTLATAFLSLGFSLKDNFILDFKESKSVAWLWVVIIPALLLLLNVHGYVKVLEITGVIAGGLLMIFILYLHQVAKKEGARKPEFMITQSFLLKLLILLFICVGIGYTLLSL